MKMQFDHLIKGFLLGCLLGNPTSLAFSSEEQAEKPVPVAQAEDETTVVPLLLDLEAAGEAPAELGIEEATEPTYSAPTFESMYEAKARAKRAQQGARADEPEA